MQKTKARREKVVVWVSSEEKKEIEKRAEEDHLDVSSYCRRNLLLFKTKGLDP